MRELFREFVAGKEREEASRARDLSFAWHVEAFARQKTLPRLEVLLQGLQGPKRQSLSEQRAMLQVLSEQYGIPVRQVARG